MVQSRYTLLVDNVSSVTPKRDIIREFERVAGSVVECSVDPKHRQALVEMRYSDDADLAYRRVHNTPMDGRTWRVEWATPSDFRNFGWRWNEGTEDVRGHGAGGLKDYGGYGASGSSGRYRSPSPSSHPPHWRRSDSGYNDSPTYSY